MFLVFEKETVGMNDGTTELNLYFLEKHNDRMNRELHAYKKKMNMRYKPQVYECKTRKEIIFVYAWSESQALKVLHQNLYKVDQIKSCWMDDRMNLNGSDMTFKTMVKNRKTPVILGGY